MDNKTAMGKLTEIIAKWNYEKYDSHYLDLMIKWEDYVDQELYLEPAREQAAHILVELFSLEN